MAIKEKDLQTINSLSDGDKLRVVTSEGNSRNIDAGTVGNSLIINVSNENYRFILNKTFNEIDSALKSGKLCVVIFDFDEILDYFSNGYHVTGIVTGTYIDVEPNSACYVILSGVDSASRFYVTDNTSLDDYPRYYYGD